MIWHLLNITGRLVRIITGRTTWHECSLGETAKKA